MSIKEFKKELDTKCKISEIKEKIVNSPNSDKIYFSSKLYQLQINSYFLYEDLKNSFICKLVVYNKLFYEKLLKKHKKKNIIFIDLFGSGYRKIFIKVKNFFSKILI